jgi:hypothetical protein
VTAILDRASVPSVVAHSESARNDLFRILAAYHDVKPAMSANMTVVWGNKSAIGLASVPSLSFPLKKDFRRLFCDANLVPSLSSMRRLRTATGNNELTMAFDRAAVLITIR